LKGADSKKIQGFMNTAGHKVGAKRGKKRGQLGWSLSGRNGDVR